MRGFQNLTQNDGVLKIVKFFQLTKVLKFHCLTEFFNDFVIVISYYRFF